MGKITGTEVYSELPDKVKLLYQAVGKLVEEGADITNIKVSDITELAGIGKGTAYDYFDSKEEIIALGLVYYIAGVTEGLKQELAQKGNFYERLNYLLDQTERQMGERTCLLRFVHLLFDATPTGNMLRNIIEKHTDEEFPAMLLISYVIGRGMEDGELNQELTAPYMSYVLLTKLIAYMAYLNNKEKKDCSDARFRRQLTVGIMKEFCSSQQEAEAQYCVKKN